VSEIHACQLANRRQTDKWRASDFSNVRTLKETGASSDTVLKAERTGIGSSRPPFAANTHLHSPEPAARGIPRAFRRRDLTAGEKATVGFVIS